MNRSFSYYADGVLSKILGVILAAVTFSYYVRGANLILFSLVFGFCASEVYLSFLGKKPSSLSVPAEIEYALCSMGSDGGTALLGSLAGEGARMKDGVVLKGNSAAIWRVNFSPLTPDDIVKIASICGRENVGRVTILANRIEETAAKYACENGITVLDLAGSLDALLKLGYRPPALKNKNRHGLRRTFINKTRAKGYLFCAVVMLVSASRVRFSVWYVVSAGILMGLCAISLIPRKN